MSDAEGSRATSKLLRELLCSERKFLATSDPAIPVAFQAMIGEKMLALEFGEPTSRPGVGRSFLPRADGEPAAASPPRAPSWSLGRRAFGAGERLAPGAERRARDAAPYADAIGQPRAEARLGNLLVLMGSGRPGEALVIRRWRSSEDSSSQILVWLDLPTRDDIRPAGRGGATRGGPAGEQPLGPAMLLEIGAPPEAFAELANAVSVSHASRRGPSVFVDVLERYVRALAGSSEVPIGPAAELIARQIAELLRASLDGERSSIAAPAETRRDRRIATILSVIQAGCSAPELSPEDVASRVGVSVRYVQRLLQPTGMTLGEHLIRARLDRARALLADPGRRKIIDVAFDCGFKDVTHFARRFKARFGMTPRDSRRLWPRAVSASANAPEATAREPLAPDRASNVAA
jgi:AraC-like DNA-binding protein